MPRPGPIVTPFVSDLISGTSYPNLPTADALESIKGILLAKQTCLGEELERASKRQKKRKDAPSGGDDLFGGGGGDGVDHVGLKGRGGSVPRHDGVDRARLEGLARKGSPAKVKRERNSASPAPSNASSVAFKPPTSANVITYGQAQKLKQKKKLKLQDSDDERVRDRSTTLAASPPHHPQASSLKLKLPNQPKQRPDHSPAPSTSGIDFSLPSQASRPLVPPRPGVLKPLKPGPKRQSEVDEDYSNTKAPNQVLFTTFWTSIEPYLREIREDDLAMLGFKADAPESYDIPPKGRHYSEVWDEEDGVPIGTTPRVSVPNMRPIPPTSNYGSNGHFVPASELKDENLIEEYKGLGSITERVVAAFVPDKEVAKVKAESVKGKAAEEGGQREGLRVDVAELEERMKRELRSVLLLGEHEEFDPLKRDDDEITSALRSCQRQLLHQTTLNDARKSRLAEVAKQRLAFTEYMNMLEGIEKGIEAGWAKRVKKYGLTPNKKAGVTVERQPKPPVSSALKQLVATRERWQNTVGKIMKERKGAVFGLPTTSIYEGIEGEIEERDEKLVDEAVEVDHEDEE